MATLLSLVQDVGRDSGTLPNWSTIATLAGAPDRALKIRAWVIEAWLSIQNEERDWFWMQASAVGDLVIGQTAYAGATLTGSARFGDWMEDSYYHQPVTLYDDAIGLSDEAEIEQIDYEEWFRKYARGTHDANRPTEWAISPANELVLGSKPDAAYKIRVRYVKTPQILSADADTPELPSRFHNLIKWEALRLLQIADGGEPERQLAVIERERLRSQLNQLQLPPITIGAGPIA